MAKGRAYERIEREVRSRVAEGRWAVGARLPTERDLAASFGVSRPTVREALRVLVREGVLNVRRGAGVTVIARPAPSPRAEHADMRNFEILEARIAVEGETAYLAAQRISEGQLDELDHLVTQLEQADVTSELPIDADRKFHLLVATATVNGALMSAVRTLWDARVSLVPPLGDRHAANAIRAGEHRLIAAALRDKKPDAARQAMRAHLERAGRSLMAAIEAREVTNARAKVVSAYGRYLSVESGADPRPLEGATGDR